MYLFETIGGIVKSGIINKQIPDYILDNLSKNIKLRPYQEDAIKHTLIYLETDLSKNKQTHLLYHMATGSGKTVIMAMNILYYYKLGYRNFLFFTNRTNIVSKTKINFTKKESSKYLFAENIMIDGKQIKINVVETFQESDPNCINICFNTVQGIQSSLNLLHEGKMSISDFEDNDVVMLADEAHHLNSTTVKDKQENEDNQTWESTVYNLLLANKNNVLLEYTATCDLRDPNVEAKYIDKIVYNFRLFEFREAGYTKEFSNFTSDTSKWIKTLQALIMSEFRKLMFEKHNIGIQPVVLLKSKVIKESNEFYNQFFEELKNLDISTIEAIRDNSKTNVYLSNAFTFFDSINLTTSKLIQLLQMDFAQEFTVNMNELNDANESIVNNLDEKDNKYRLIFIVDKLTEGWDVLSLFDIVRLYDTRQGGPKGTVSKYTISEAQLIGRGARYCPFKFEDDQRAEIRKYNNVVGTPEAICETLLYHCMQEARYIEELKKALIATGLTPVEEMVEVKYTVKESFKGTDLFKTGFIFSNTRVEKNRSSVTSLPANFRNSVYNFNCKSLVSSTGLLFGGTINNTTRKRKELSPIYFKDLDFSVVYKAFRVFNNTISFEFIKSKFPNLKTLKEFITSDSYLGNIQIIFHVYEGETYSKQDIFDVCYKVFEDVSNYISKIKVTYEGTKEFHAIPINSKVTNLIRKYRKDRLDTNNGIGIPQNDPYVDPKFRYDVTDKDWYVYNNNFGTTEEKAFVKYFASKMDELRKKYDKVYLIRNEQQVKVYSFDNGEAFEPDYILLLIKEDQPKNAYFCVFVEPKGNHLLEHDAWKGQAMLEFSKHAIPVVKFVDDNNYKIWGTPLYNEDNTKQDFNKYFDDSLLK